MTKTEENQAKEEANSGSQNTSPKEKGGPLPGRSRNTANQNKQGPGGAANAPPLAGVKTPNKQKTVMVKQQQQSSVVVSSFLSVSSMHIIYQSKKKSKTKQTKAKTK